MLPIGVTRYIDFALADVSSNPVPGRTLSVWQTSPNKLIFLRNMVACTDTLNLKDYGDGRYSIYYNPSAPGHDYLEVYDQPTDITTIDNEDIVAADFATGGGSVFTLDQNYGGANNLKVNIAQPNTYILQVYLASDWDNGRRNDSYAVGATTLNSDGTWVISISVPAGVYDIVVTKSNQQQVLWSYLGVGS